MSIGEIVEPFSVMSSGMVKFMSRFCVITLSFCSSLMLTSLAQGCAPTDTVRSKQSDKEIIEILHKHERTFNPADYDPEVPFEVKEESQEPQQPEEPSIPAEEAELVGGFRVQVTFTDNIDQANTIKDQVALLVGDENVYVVYEAPYYKVRVGDFLSRPDANKTLNILFQNGYKDSWIVPDKVRKR